MPRADPADLLAMDAAMVRDPLADRMLPSPSLAKEMPVGETEVHEGGDGAQDGCRNAIVAQDSDGFAASTLCPALVVMRRP